MNFAQLFWWTRSSLSTLCLLYLAYAPHIQSAHAMTFAHASAFVYALGVLNASNAQSTCYVRYKRWAMCTTHSLLLYAYCLCTPLPWTILISYAWHPLYVFFFLPHGFPQPTKPAYFPQYLHIGCIACIKCTAFRLHKMHRVRNVQRAAIAIVFALLFEQSVSPDGFPILCSAYVLHIFCIYTSTNSTKTAHHTIYTHYNISKGQHIVKFAHRPRCTCAIDRLIWLRGGCTLYV